MSQNSRNRKRRELYSYSRVGVTHSLVEADIFQIIEKIIGRRLQIEDLVGTRIISRISGSYPGLEIFRGQMSLRSLETNFQFCLRKNPKTGTAVIISESWFEGSRGVRHYFREEGEDSFREMYLESGRFDDPDLWGGRVPESARTEAKIYRR